MPRVIVFGYELAHDPLNIEHYISKKKITDGLFQPEMLKKGSIWPSLVSVERHSPITLCHISDSHTCISSFPTRI